MQTGTSLSSCKAARNRDPRRELRNTSKYWTRNSTQHSCRFANNSNSGADANSSGDNDQDNGATSDSKTYAVGRTVTHTIRPPGMIRRISAAILVDNDETVKLLNKTEAQVSLPRSPAELKQIQALASAVLGLDPARGDVVTVENIPFQITSLPPPTPLHGLKLVAPFLNQYGYLVRYILLGLLGLMIFVFVVKPLVKQLGAPSLESSVTVQPQIEPGAEAAAVLAAAPGGVAGIAGAGGAPSTAALPEMSAEKAEFAVLKESVIAKISKTPTEAGRLIEGWLREDEE
jgi:flagellar M-ring protein FliF